MELETLTPRWTSCVVAGTGPSLTAAVAEQCRGSHVIAVNDAYRLMPFADVLYACDAAWWTVHRGVPEFTGEKWSSHSKGNEKQEAAKRYGLRLVAGKRADGFSTDPSCIHYGGNSGFQAVNLAILWGCTRILLVGFDMKTVRKKRHFFGNHPAPLNNPWRFDSFIQNFAKAAKSLPAGVEILNCTPGSALQCFPMVSLEAAL